MSVSFVCISEELNLDVEMVSSEWTEHSPENLRPPTPTGYLADSDPDLLRSKPTSPTEEEVERPPTPGRGILAELGSDDSDHGNANVLSFYPASTFLATLEPQILYPLYQDIPRTPGKEERGGFSRYTSVTAPATPRREISMSDSSSPDNSLLPMCGNAYMRAPKTPGRDIILPRRTIVHHRKMPLTNTLHARGSPSSLSSSCSLSDGLSDSADDTVVRISSGVRQKPLQGLENVPGLFSEENRKETKKSLLRRKELRMLKRKWRVHHWQKSLKQFTGLLTAPCRSHRYRTHCEEKRILHSVWKEGLDEEDAKLLKGTYERLQEQDNGIGWLSDTLWISHPDILLNTVSEHEFLL